ncbi:MAG TPA: MSMEG_6728 family protein [Candidatus Thermoplasmatota archaeon]|jgi:hypothetical protein|nr:MSMEG_6728 family protein [Candidatus Thermoplasmatota archaeon]
MQTFLPYPDFAASAAALDPRRLGKQRVEALTILRTLKGRSFGWAQHPAVKMWRGCEAALTAYMDACIREWMKRGYRNTMPLSRVRRYRRPEWLGDDAFHASHRANLLRKEPAWYGRFGWREDPRDPYVWPRAVDAEAMA